MEEGVVHLINRRIFHLFFVHIFAMPLTLGWTIYQLLNGYIFIPITFFSISLPQLQLGWFIGVLSMLGLYFVGFKGIEHYTKWEEFNNGEIS